jgi:septin family protein
VLIRRGFFFQEEISSFKERINTQIRFYGIKIYEFPDESCAIADDNDKKAYHKLKVRMALNDPNVAALTTTTLSL